MYHPHSVLVIDDDPNIRKSLKDCLEDSGYIVFTAGDGLEGLEAFARLKPDMVLTDLRMPKLDGFGVISAIKAESPETPVIAFTGTGEHHVVADAERLGAWCCLFKPLGDLNNLNIAIEMALTRTPPVQKSA